MGKRVRNPADTARWFDQRSQFLLGNFGPRLNVEAAVPKLATSPRAADDDAQARQLPAALGGRERERQAEAARDRGAQQFGRHHSRVVAPVMLWLVDGDLVAARLYSRLKAAKPRGGYLESVRHRARPSVPADADRLERDEQLVVDMLVRDRSSFPGVRGGHLQAGRPQLPARGPLTS